MLRELKDMLGHYSITKFKSFTGTDGLGFNATLLKDGKKVCFVIDEGCGGCMHFDFTSREEQQAFEAHVAMIEKSEFEPCDMFMHKAIDLFETQRSIVRRAKRKTCYLASGDPFKTERGWEFRILDEPFSPTVRERVVAHFMKKGQSVRFLNEEVA